jgi:hypothetical protein
MKKVYQLIGIIGLISILLSPHIIVLAQEGSVRVREDGSVELDDGTILSKEEITILSNEEIERNLKLTEKGQKNPGLTEEAVKLEPGKTLTKEQIDELQKNQQPAPPYQSQLETAGVKIGSLGNCMDTYKFGSIKINITQDQQKYNPGDIIQLKGSIKNENVYPVTGLTISARLVKNIPNSNDQAFSTTLDEFIIAKDIAIKGNSSIDIKQLYNLNLQSPKGEYELLFFAYQQDRFTLSGLPFTDDVVGYKVKFDVGGDNTEQVYLDQTRTTVGDKKNINHGFITNHHNKDEKIQVKIPLKNITDKVQDIELTSQLYSWDGLRKESLQKEEKEIIKVPAKGEVLITRTVEKAELPVYYLKFTATQAGNIAPAQKYTSISNIRFSVPNNQLVRFNWVGLNSFPQGDKVVTCIHNTSNGTVNDIEVETKVLDSKGKEITKSLYKGAITGEIDAIIADLPKNKTYNKLTVVSTIKDGSGNIIDSVNIPYDCQAIDASICGKENVSNEIITNILSILGIIAIILGAVYAIYIQRKTITKLIKK